MSGLHRLQELTVCTEDNVDVHDIELMQYINVDCSKLKRLLQGQFPSTHLLSPSTPAQPCFLLFSSVFKSGLDAAFQKPR